MSDIDPVEFGRLLGAMQALRETIASDRQAREAEKAEWFEEMDGLKTRLDALEGKLRMGKFTGIGLIVGLCFAIFGIKETLQALWDKV